jgi:hypothetical protein
MRHLIKVIISLLAILILHVIKSFLSNTSPAYFFLYNLFSNYELFVLLLVVLMFIFERFFFRKLAARKSILASFIVSMIIFALGELSCIYLLFHPQHIPARLNRYFVNYYYEFDVNGLQWEEGVCHYDTLLFYAMNPNRQFVFSNREYSDTFLINKNGFRSGTHDGEQPDIICLGDSHTLGIGVGQNQTFSSIISKSTGLKVLNTGNSSYGTARESLSLGKMDTSKVKYLLWQYCQNDADENRAYVQNGYRYVPPPPSQFNYARALNRWNTSYYPGKHVLTILKLVASTMLGKRKEFAEFDQAEQAINFLKILNHRMTSFPNAKIIVFDLGFHFRSDFSKSLKVLLADPRYNQLSSKVLVLDLAPLLNSESYYKLDPHLTPKGQMIVANELTRVLQSMTVETP